MDCGHPVKVLDGLSRYLPTVPKWLVEYGGCMCSRAVVTLYRLTVDRVYVSNYRRSVLGGLLQTSRPVSECVTDSNISFQLRV